MLVKQEAVIASKIITLRDEKVILDVHLAALYDVETRILKQAVRRNRDRFPDDFMYELTDLEIDEIKRTVEGQNQNIQLVFEYLKQLEQAKHEKLEQTNRNRVGYKRNCEQ